MLEMIKKYSEDVYYRKSDLAKELEPNIASVVWEEVKKDRKQYFQEYSFLDYKIGIVWNRLVTSELLKVQQSCYRCLQMHSNFTFYIPKSMKEEDKQKWMILVHQQSYTRMYTQEWFYHALCIFEIEKKVDNTLFAFLLNDEISIFLKIFVTGGYLRERDSLLINNLLFLYYGLHGIEHIVENVKIDIESGCISENNDKTYYFLQYLMKIWLIISDIMVSLYRYKKNDSINYTYEELIERYPQLTKEQLYFYHTHHESEHYYTINNYMRACNVCYETARYSLDKLVEECWYQKQKMGKKFVYFIY
ncbi:MAG: hypothetical protein RR766_00740 [Longicatena sp.]